MARRVKTTTIYHAAEADGERAMIYQGHDGYYTFIMFTGWGTFTVYSKGARYSAFNYPRSAGV